MTVAARVVEAPRVEAVLLAEEALPVAEVRPAVVAVAVAAAADNK